MNNNDSEGKEKNKNFTVFDSFLTVEVNSSAGFFRFWIKIVWIFVTNWATTTGKVDPVDELVLQPCIVP